VNAEPQVFDTGSFSSNGMSKPMLARLLLCGIGAMG
jgi:hypothetical protein